MSYLKQFTIICLVSFVALVLDSLLPISLGGTIVSMLLLFLLLTLKVIKIGDIDKVSRLFFSYMGVLFVPPTVAIIEQVGEFGSLELFHFVWISVAAGLLTAVVTALAVKLTLIAMRRNR